MTAASYRKFSFAVAPGATQRIDRAGDFFHVISADQDFMAGWDDDAPTPFFAGLEYEVRDGGGFQSAQIVNTSGAVLNIVLGVGRGGIRDGRFTVSGALDVRDNGGASFDEVVTSVEALSTDVLAVKAAVADADMTADLRSATFTSLINPGTVTVVSAAANVNGVVIDYMHISCATSGNARIEVDGQTILRVDGASEVTVEKRFIVPSGQAVQVVSSSSDLRLAMVTRLL